MNGGWRTRPRRAAGPGRPRNIWLQLAFLVAVLVFLLLFMRQIGERSAGCFVQLTEPTAGHESAPPPAAPGPSAPSGGPGPAAPPPPP